MTNVTVSERAREAASDAFAAWLNTEPPVGERIGAGNVDWLLRAFAKFEAEIREECAAGVDDYDRDLIAYNIIQGSAGIRAAEHAKDFQTGNWTDALRSADAVMSALSAIRQKGQP